MKGKGDPSFSRKARDTQDRCPAEANWKIADMTPTRTAGDLQSFLKILARYVDLRFRNKKRSGFAQ